MADDSSYEAFLNKANADLSSSTSSAPSHQNQKPTHAASISGNNIPAPLKSIVNTNSHTYTSDTDSQWEPVLISYTSSSSPSVQDFQKAISTTANVQELPLSEFDPRNQYASVIDAVKKAAAAAAENNDQIKIFRVEVDRTRVDYYVLAISHQEKKLVGVVARAVES